MAEWYGPLTPASRIGESAIFDSRAGRGGFPSRSQGGVFVISPCWLLFCARYDVFLGALRGFCLLHLLTNRAICQNFAHLHRVIQGVSNAVGLDSRGSPAWKIGVKWKSVIAPGIVKDFNPTTVMQENGASPARFKLHPSTNRIVSAAINSKEHRQSKTGTRTEQL